MSTVRVTVMSKDEGFYTTFVGEIRVHKNSRTGKWVIIKEFSDEEVKLYEQDPEWDKKDYCVHEFDPDKYYLILQ